MTFIPRVGLKAKQNLGVTARIIVEGDEMAMMLFLSAVVLR